MATESLHRPALHRRQALALLAGKGDALTDYGIRYYGIPAGHEFNSLVHDLHTAWYI